ncbi:pyruvate dehydrogenase complex dihydrolipoamide acetyltransferase [Sphingorhabdus sp. SMR4y]|uniref:pyruvate dehydrogenase complex dihydrolipoamide acetyltransferase n=1 Tax=Sphingorhabdus sp. SMR4y TaxID=2584094 RepID=UPI000B5CCAB6|nr:pyruvate dehydrogenase complex dihydrolipoamide acetyltransferase [Sphingorhabdus sp. SMR4y]ASK87586.1 dihydrolipoyllysine-residue acetyltransferase component of pyruvate dehydrogenase complex [Sphingorhabdus sp. SMR4y]
MPINLQMPALSPTMEEGTLAKWLVKEGDSISSGDLLAEIETDKATMEFEAIDEGVIAKIVVAEGTENVKVGDVIAIIAEEGEDASEAKAAPAPKAEKSAEAAPKKEEPAPTPAPKASPAPAAKAAAGANDDRLKISPLARRLAEQKGVDLTAVSGSGPGGRIVKADIDAAEGGTAPVKTETPAPAASPAPSSAPKKGAETGSDFDIPHTVEKLSGMRKTIARRLTEAKQTIPHYRVSIDINIDKLLALRGELNASLESRGVKLSVNDLLIKAQAVALMQQPDCNVSFTEDNLIRYERADIAVAVSIKGGLITPIVTSADSKSLSAIATEMKDLAERAKAGKLKMHEYQGGTASLSNMGMFGVTTFDAVINPPQAMILAISAGIKKPVVVEDNVQIATIMNATGSFDHRAIDGATGAAFMKAFKEIVESPMGMLA